MTQGRDNLSEEELNQVKDQVWQQFVNNTIMENEAAKLGLTVTDQELQNVLKAGTNPMLMQTPFVNQETGRFDVTQLTKFLSDYKKAQQTPEVAEQYQRIYNYWKFIEKQLRDNLLGQKYQTLLAQCLFSNPISAKQAFAGQNEESDIQLAAIPYSTIKDNEVQVTDAEVVPSAADRTELMKSMNDAKTQLEAGMTPAEVVRKAQSTVAYQGFAVSRAALPTDVAAQIDSMQIGQVSKVFETRFDNTLNVVKYIAKVQLPDSVEYRQIQVGGETVEDAHKRADSIYTALKGGADFEALAKKYGQTAEKQWLTSQMYERMTTPDADTKEYLTSLTTLGVNELKNLALTQGNIIFQVTDRKNMIDKYDVAVVKHTIDFSKETYSQAYNNSRGLGEECC